MNKFFQSLTRESRLKYTTVQRDRVLCRSKAFRTFLTSIQLATALWRSKQCIYAPRMLKLQTQHIIIGPQREIQSLQSKILITFMQVTPINASVRYLKLCSRFLHLRFPQSFKENRLTRRLRYETGFVNNYVIVKFSIVF